MAEYAESTMTIANVSMTPKEETARIIRATCEKYKIPISRLMNAMISSQLKNIDHFAKEVQKEQQRFNEEEARRKNEMISQARQTGKPGQMVNLFDEWKKLDHNQTVLDARMSNLANDFSIVNGKLDRLLEALGEKPIMGGENGLEPIDSKAWIR